MSMTLMNSVPSNFSEILKDMPAGAWAAVSERDQRVIAFGSDMQSVLSEAQQKGETVPLIVKVPERPEILFF